MSALDPVPAKPRIDWDRSPEIVLHLAIMIDDDGAAAAVATVAIEDGQGARAVLMELTAVADGAGDEEAHRIAFPLFPQVVWNTPPSTGDDEGVWPGIGERVLVLTHDITSPFFATHIGPALGFEDDPCAPRLWLTSDNTRRLLPVLAWGRFEVWP